MRTRLVAIVLVLAGVATLFTWLTLWPLLRPLWAYLLQGGEAPSSDVLIARVRVITLPLLLLNLIGVGVLAYVVLYFTVGRPLRRTEELVEQMETLRLELPMNESGGPLLSAVQASLRRMADALRREQKTTAAQMRELSDSNERLRETQNELVRAEQLALLGRLAAGVAHEVGNPLMGVLGYLSLLKAKPNLPPEADEYLTRIEEEVQRIDGIVRGLLELGRPPHATKTPLRLREVVLACASLLSSGKDFRRVTVQVEVAEALMVASDRAMLSQVLINLLLNGMQAMDGAGALRVSAETDAASTHIHVDDEGPGLPSEVIGRIFEPFFTTKAAGKGTGLGLAVSQQLVTALGGRLVASNRAPRGARFTISLPNAEAAVDARVAE